jgi:serine/threonine protein kinase
MRTRTAGDVNYFSEPTLIQMYKSMLKTISEVHALRIAHRNIECSNWLVTQGRELKLTDFGIAKLVQNKDTFDVHTIRPGAKNISRYLLEMRRMDEFSEGDVFAEDIWALGKVFLELMTLKVYLNVNAKQETELAQFIETRRAELSYSPIVGRVITRMLADPPRPRCNELLQLLEQPETTA